MSFLLFRYIGRTPPRTRISIGFFAYFILVALVPVLDALTVGGAGIGSTVSFALTLAAVAISGVVDALIQGSLFGMAAELPSMYTQALTAGTSASGLVTSSLRIATKLLLPATETGLRWSAYLYFAISALVLFVCGWAYQYLNTLPIVKSNQARGTAFAALPTDAAPLLEPGSEDGRSGSGASLAEQSRGKSEAGGSDSGTPTAERDSDSVGLVSRRADSGEIMEQELLDAQAAVANNAGRSTGFLGRFLGRFFYLDALTVEGKAMSVATVPPGQQLEVLSIVWPYATSLTLVYIVTLSIFPGFISELKDASLGTWYPILLMAAFNLCDFVGKMTPVLFVIENDSVLFAAVLGRFLFYPLYSACLGTPTTPLAASVLLPSLTALLGFSNGLLTSLLMMAAPAVVSEEQAEATGTIMVLFLVIGLALGSIGAWVWVTTHF